MRPDCTKRYSRPDPDAPGEVSDPLPHLPGGGGPDVIMEVINIHTEAELNAGPIYHVPEGGDFEFTDKFVTIFD